MSRNKTSSAASRRPEKRFFKDRELILRTDGKVVFFRLGAGVQKGMCVFGGIVFAWAAVASLSTWWQLRVNDDKAQEIVEARLSYQQLRGDLKAYQSKIAELASDIADRQRQTVGEEHAALSDAVASAPLEIDLAALAEISSGIGTAFDKMARDLDVSEQDRDRIVQSRNSLHQKIGELEDTLGDERRTVSRLNEDILRLEDVLENRGRSITDLEGTRDTLSDRIVELSDSLRDAERRGEQLVSDVRGLTGRIETLSNTNETHVEARNALNADIDRLGARLAVEQARGKDAREGMARLIADVSKVLGDQDGGAAIESEEPKEFVETLDNELAAMIARYEETETYARRVDGALSHVLNSLERVTGPVPEKTTESNTSQVLAERAEASDDGVLENQDSDIASLPDVASDASVASLDRPGQARALVDEIERLHSAQLSLIEGLNAQVEAEVNEAEDLLRMAGLDVEALVGTTTNTGSGGPLEDVGFGGGSSEGLAQGVAALQGLVERRRALAKTLRCIPLVAPIDYYHVTSPFGKRKDPINGRWSMHKGLDLGAWPGTKIRATGAGKVIEARTHNGYGKMVRIDHGCGITTVYAHMKRISVKRGQEVTHRQVIGTLGSTGRSTGPHVHYEIRVDGAPVDPAKVMEAGRHVFKT